MTPVMFWRSTPVRLNALTHTHYVTLNPDKPKIARTVEEAGIEI